MNILNKSSKPIPEPPQVEQWRNEMHGDLICSKCKKIIVTDCSERDQWEGYILSAIRAHFCGKPFSYDFNDLRTIKEQQAAANLC